MQINKNRKGLALGAALSLFASLFVGAMPASANTDGQYIALTPAAGPVTNFNGTVAEDFRLQAYVLPGQSAWTANTTVVFHEITKVSGAMEVLALAVSDSALVEFNALASPASESYSLQGVTSSSTVSIEASSSTAVTLSYVAGTNGIAHLNLKAYTLSGVVSSSPSVTLTIKTWVENLATSNGRHDALEWFTTKTVVLHSINAIPTTVTIGSPIAGNTVVTASGTVSALNFENLSGSFALQLASTYTDFATATSASQTVSAAISGSVMADRAGVVSNSFAILTSGGLQGGTSLSGLVIYKPAGGDATVGTGAEPAANHFRLGSLATSVLSATAADTLLVQAVSSSNSVMPGASSATVRANTTVTYRVTATSNSASVSGAVVSVAITANAAGALSLNVKEISVNGAAATTSYPAALSLTTGANGTATFTLQTIGFEGDEVLTITAREQNVNDSLTVDVKGIVPTLTADYSRIAMAPGTTTAVTYNVKDQWGVSYAGSDLRVAVTKGGVAGFTYTDTLSYVAVVAGKASFNFSPTPVTKTGSATVTARLQQLQSSTGTYINEANGSDVVVNVNVSGTADSFGTGLATSYSASVSYFPSTLAAAVAVSGKVANTGSAVVISANGLVFEDAEGDTYSDTITVRAGADLGYSVNVYGTKSGTYTLTLTNGSATTTSQFVVRAAAHDSGTAISFDTTAIEAGKTKIVTGRVVDMNGNPVNTTAGHGTASIVVTFAGSAGIPVGAMPTETNADGEFQVSVLTSAADRGTFTLTATYLKAGASTVVADQVTAVQAITVGASTAAPASDQKLTVGSFKGFVAIYALNYTGQKLSAKVAGKWLVVNELSKFQRVVRNTGAGFTIKVDLYIDGAFVRSETVVTK